jgi:exopolysaccharide biosynthesis polyprenyl glycosylphosphotransferase
MSDNPETGIEISAAGLQRERGHIGRQWLVAGLLAGDLLCVCTAMALGFGLKFYTPLGALGVSSSQTIDWLAYLPQFSLAAALFTGRQLYSGRYSRSGLLASPLLGVRAAFFWGLLLALVSLGLKVEPSLSRLFVLYSTLILAGLLPCWRFVYTRRWIAQRGCRTWVQRQVLVVGWNAQVAALLQRGEDRRKLYPLQVIGVVGDVGAAQLPDGVQHWPAATSLGTLLQARHYDEVILAEGSLERAAADELQLLCGRELIDFAVLPAAMTSLTSCLHLESVQGVPLLTQSQRPLDRIELAVLKRALDVVGGLVGLLLFAPLIALFAAIVYRESPGPVFYRQTRTGRGGQPFQMIKIRSMGLDADKTDHLSQSTQRVDSRVLKIGALMRRLNIDELPQFWNVLKGEMSLVGPRPERIYHVNQLKMAIAHYNIRHTVKPGLTGWAQVNGWRGDTCLQSRIACDLEYIESASLWFDIRIILMTLRSTKNAY